MDNLKELVEAVKEDNLTKDMLEKYHTNITYLDNVLRLELAPIEKEEALFFKENKFTPIIATGSTHYVETGKKENADVAIKRMWRATEKGQRQIELNAMLKITPKLLQSIKTRLYSIY